ncbi:MAG: RsmE family RNA methyltransferase [bacterium]
MQRFYFSTDKFQGNYAVSDDKNLIHQLAKVLRAKEGERFIIFDGSGYEYNSQLITLDKKQAKFLLLDKIESKKELSSDIIIYQSILKGEKFDWLLQKCTELGIKKIVPVVSDRSIVKNITPAKLKRQIEIIREATEQCGRSCLMEISPAVTFEQALKTITLEGGEKFIAWEKETENLVSPIKAKKINLLVGPEGGYDQKEIDLAKKIGITPVSLGQRILRAETATIYLASIFSYTNN